MSNAADALMAIFGLRRVDTDKVQDCLRKEVEWSEPKATPPGAVFVEVGWDANGSPVEET